MTPLPALLLPLALASTGGSPWAGGTPDASLAWQGDPDGAYLDRCAGVTVSGSVPAAAGPRSGASGGGAIRLPDELAPIVRPGDRFQVRVARDGGFAGGASLAPVKGARVLSRPRLADDGVGWLVRATGGPCDLALTATAPDDACLLSFPVETGVLGAMGDVTFVNTTHGLGVEVRRGERVVFSLAPIVAFEGNCDGAPARLVRFEPSYAYLDQHRAHFYGELLDMWRVHLECYLEADGLEVKVTLTPRYETDLRRVAVGAWLEGSRQVHEGDVLRLEHTLPIP